MYVLKDTWRDDRRGLEGVLYEKAGEGEGLARLHCHGIVYIDGSPDTTADAIRRGLLPPENSSPQLADEKKQSDNIDWTTDVRSIPTPAPREEDAHPPESKLHARTHSRTIMSTYGWPIYRFATFQEVVNTIIFALKGGRGPSIHCKRYLTSIPGHQHLYQHGILHRDISPGNILITPDNRGVLIDLDYSIDMENHQTLASDERTVNIV